MRRTGAGKARGGTATGIIRAARPADAGQIADIYNHYIRHTGATFEETPLTRPRMARRIRDISGRWPYLVWDAGGTILGYAYADRFKVRTAYRHTVESTLYVRDGFQRRGIGRALYGELLAALEAREVRAVIGCVAMPNPGSVALHRALGFRRVARLANVGRKFGRWLDVTWWELEYSAFTPAAEG